ncbi:MAG: hypothetical protein ACK5WZ_13005 [Pseudobdellovibrionaceae bacterium]
MRKQILKIAVFLKSIFRNFMTLMLCAVMLFSFIFSMNVEAKSKTTKKVALVAGVGIAGAIAAICLFPGSTTNSTRSQTSNLRAISSFAAAQPTVAAPAALRSEPIGSAAAQSRVQIESQRPVDLSCLRDEQKNAFRVVALREQLTRAASTCQLHNQFNSVVPRLNSQFRESRRMMTAYFRNQTREDAYLTDVAGEQALIIARSHNQGNQQFCRNQQNLFAQVAALPSAQALVQFAAANPQPMVSPCTRSR